MGWAEFVGSGANDGFVQRLLRWIGWVYLICAGVTITVRRGAKVQMAVLMVGTGLLTVLAYSKFVSAQHQIPMLLEHGCQMLSPALLVMALIWGARHRATVTVAMVAFITTFAGHGVYAIGWLPTPGNFHAMTSLILGVEFETANRILPVAGALDMAVCIGILLPKWRQVSALYAGTWGLLTAIARPVAGMSMSLNYWGGDQFLHEAVLRAPHFLLPWYLFLVWRYPDESRAAESISPNVSGDSKNPAPA